MFNLYSTSSTFELEKLQHYSVCNNVLKTGLGLASRALGGGLSPSPAHGPGLGGLTDK